MPILQVRAERPQTPVGRCMSNFTDMYRDELRIVGVGPTPLAGSVLRDMLSLADAEYVKNLGWHELVQRSNTAAVEAAALNAEVSSRASLARKQSFRDCKNYETTIAELEKNLEDLKLSFEKEKANSRARKEDMRMGFQAELLKLQNELRVAELHLEASQGELKGAQEQLSEATQELEGA